MKKKDKKFDNIMKWVKMNRAASREADIEFQIPRVKHTVTEDKKKKADRDFCKNFKF